MRKREKNTEQMTLPENTLIVKDKDKVVGFTVHGPSRDEDLPDAGVL